MLSLNALKSGRDQLDEEGCLLLTDDMHAMMKSQSLWRLESMGRFVIEGRRPRSATRYGFIICPDNKLVFFVAAFYFSLQILKNAPEDEVISRHKTTEPYFDCSCSWSQQENLRFFLFFKETVKNNTAFVP